LIVLKTVNFKAFNANFMKDSSGHMNKKQTTQQDATTQQCTTLLPCHLAVSNYNREKL
jgi:hypothetical protein